MRTYRSDTDDFRIKKTIMSQQKLHFCEFAVKYVHVLYA